MPLIPDVPEPNKELMRVIDKARAEILDAFTYGTGVTYFTDRPIHVSIYDFFKMPEPGERNPWSETIWLGFGEGDDGGGAAIAAYQFGLCPFAR